MHDERSDDIDQYWDESLNRARRLAQVSHAGQVDKAGKPYFVHVETVSRTVGDLISGWYGMSDDFSVKARIVGYLHDVIEDTEMTVDDLWKNKIPTDCILAIEAITKIEGESYQDYLMKVKRCKLAAVLPWASSFRKSPNWRWCMFFERIFPSDSRYP